MQTFCIFACFLYLNLTLNWYIKSWIFHKILLIYLQNFPFCNYFIIKVFELIWINLKWIEDKFHFWHKLAQKLAQINFLITYLFLLSNRKSPKYRTIWPLAGAQGFEPRRTVLETVILPLYYAPKNNDIDIIIYFMSLLQVFYYFILIK